jgi:hypothetical protein
MKILFAALICSLTMATAAHSASITVPDNSSALAGVAAATTALLLDSGLKPQNTGGGVFVVEAKNFHCDQNSNAAVDAKSVRAGLPTLKCRTNSPNKRGATAGPPFGEGRAMTDLLQKVQDSKAGSSASGGAAFTDCAMGYCGTFAKSIKCTIDTKIDNYSNGGRWSCVFTDGQ